MRLCSPHSHGVAPGTAPFYDPACPRCAQKLAQGLVTGTEPRAPPLFHVARRKWGGGTVFARKRKLTP